MGQQLLTGDGRVYSPARDIVQLFPNFIGYHAVLRLAANRWPPALKKFAEFSGMTEADLAKAELAFAAFVRLTVHYAVDDYPTLWEQSGMSKLPAPVILALMAVIGEVTLGTFYKTVRGAIRQGRNVPGIEHLSQVADMSADAMRSGTPSSVSKRILAAEGAALPEILENNPNENI